MFRPVKVVKCLLFWSQFYVRDKLLLATIYLNHFLGCSNTIFCPLLDMKSCVHLDSHPCVCSKCVLQSLSFVLTSKTVSNYGGMREEIEEEIRREIEEAENRRREEIEDQRNKMRAEIEEIRR